MNPSFELVPADINFFISNPGITRLLTNTVSLLLLGTLVLFALYVSVKQIVKKKPVYLLSAAAAIILIVTLPIGSQRARFAIKPDSQTIIAAIVKDKQIVRHGFWKEYYFITEIEGKRYGVATAKDIYLMDRYKPGAPFDYSLYTYRTSSGFILYRFLKPEYKLKAAQGNLQ